MARSATPVTASPGSGGALPTHDGAASGAEPQRGFHCSRGTPRLFALERAPLVQWPATFAAAPGLADRDDVDDDSPRDALDGGLTAAGAGLTDEPDGSLERMLEATSPRAPEASPAEAEIEGVRRLLRDVIEEIGALGGLLRAQGEAPGDAAEGSRAKVHRAGPAPSWSAAREPFEARLLADVDAFAALGRPWLAATGQEARLDVVNELLLRTADAPVPDPARAFARAFTLGCIAGEDAAQAAVASLASPDAREREAVRQALALAPSPAIGPRLAERLGDAAPPFSSLGLAVLRSRREVPFELAAVMLAHPDPGTRAEAARCLAVATPGGAAARLLETMTLDEKDESVLAAAAEGLSRLGSPAGPRLVAARLEHALALPEGFPRAAYCELVRLAGSAGSRGHQAVLLRALGDDPVVAEALGWHGDPRSLAVLSSALERAAGRPALSAFARAVAGALHRITGLAWPGDGARAATLFAIEAPPDPAFWRRRMDEAAGRLDLRHRLRFGRPWSVEQTIHEAESSEISLRARRGVVLELALLSRGASRVDAEDWVARQRSELEALKTRLRAAGAPHPAAGEWLAPG